MIKLFIQNSASFDFAYLTKQHGPMGKSFYVDVTFEGKTNRKGMMVDFSIAKKIIKSVIEDIDHKLLVSDNHVKHETQSHLIVSTNTKISKVSKNTQKEQNIFFAMHARKNWIKVVSSRILNSLENECHDEFENHIAKIILNTLPKNISKVYVKLKEKIDSTQDDNNSFHYTHTLCHHVGNCQRFHGHTAQIKIFQNKNLNLNLSTDFAKKLKGLYIISSRHLYPLFNSAHLEKIKEYCFPKNTFEKLQSDLHAFEYQGSQGKVAIIISKHLALILPNEATIENITQYIHAQIPNNNGTETHVYEGLSKGAIVA